MNKIIILIVGIFLQSFAFAQTNVDSITIKKISDDVMNNGQAYENLRFLCKKSRSKAKWQ